jgi:hypothetical protein
MKNATRPSTITALPYYWPDVREFLSRLSKIKAEETHASWSIIATGK